MRRYFFILFFVFGYASAAQAQYTTATIAPCPNDGKGGVCVVYSGSNVKPTEPVDSRYYPRTAVDLAALTTARKIELNGVDTTQKAFAPGVVVADAAAPVPTQDDIDVAAFIVLVRAWQTEIAKVAAGIDGASQETIDAAKGAVNTAYTANKSAPVRIRFDTALLGAQRGGLF